MEKVDGFKDERGTIFWASPKILDFDYKYLTLGTINPGTLRGGHYHKTTEEKLLCVTGKLLVILNKEVTVMNDGDIIDIHPNVMHSVINVGETVSTFIEFKSREYTKEDPDTYAN